MFPQTRQTKQVSFHASPRAPTGVSAATTMHNAAAAAGVSSLTSWAGSRMPRHPRPSLHPYRHGRLEGGLDTEHNLYLSHPGGIIYDAVHRLNKLRSKFGRPRSAIGRFKAAEGWPGSRHPLGCFGDCGCYNILTATPATTLWTTTASR